jgi:hypothetical protein
VHLFRSEGESENEMRDVRRRKRELDERKCDERNNLGVARLRAEAARRAALSVPNFLFISIHKKYSTSIANAGCTVKSSDHLKWF